MNANGEKKDIHADLEAFLSVATQAMGGADLDPLAPQGAPNHRRLSVVVSEDCLEAHLAAIFADTTPEEIRNALKQARVCWGFTNAFLEPALAQAQKTGHVQKDILVAQGKPAEYKQRKQVSYPFLEGKVLPDTQEQLHLASRIFRNIEGLMHSKDVEAVRAYALPVVVVNEGDVLMRVQGEDVILPGRDVLGREIREIHEEERGILHAGEGTVQHHSGDLLAARFGFVGVSEHALSVISPVWLAPNAMEAYFVNPPVLGERLAPTPVQVSRLLKEKGVLAGIDEKAIDQMCSDLELGAIRESCVRIAKGHMPPLSKGQFDFKFEVVPTRQFENVRDLMQCVDKPNISDFSGMAVVVHAGFVLAVQREKDNKGGAWRNLFDEPVPAPDLDDVKKTYKAGAHVRREVRDGLVNYVSEIYGYAGVVENRIEVISPIWVAQDRMRAEMILLPDQGKKVICPLQEEMDDLLGRASVRFGIDRVALEDIVRNRVDRRGMCVTVAKGTPPEPGKDGLITLHFKQMPDPGQILDGDRIDFRQRDAVPQVHAGDLLAKRTFPVEGKPGQDVRGKKILSTKTERKLLFAGPGITLEEDGEGQVFYANRMGWARVVKDTLSVQQRFIHNGDVDFRVGNIKMEGDVEIKGSVKSRFQIEATGDVYIGGAVESRAQIVAKGNVVIQRGISGATLKVGGDLHARFVQDATLEVDGNLVVRNYVRDSNVQVLGKAVIQGNEGGQRHLCLLGGVLVAGQGVESASIGATYGRETRVVIGLDLEAEHQLERYRKGQAFCDLQMRRTMRSLGEFALPGKQSVAALKKLPEKRKQFVLKQIQDLQRFRQMKESIVFYMQEFENRRQRIAQEAKIRVPGYVFAKTEVQVGTLRYKLEEDLSCVVLGLHPNGDTVAIENLKT